MSHPCIHLRWVGVRRQEATVKCVGGPSLTAVNTSKKMRIYGAGPGRVRESEISLTAMQMSVPPAQTYRPKPVRGIKYSMHSKIANVRVCGGNGPPFCQFPEGLWGAEVATLPNNDYVLPPNRVLSACGFGNQSNSFFITRCPPAQLRRSPFL
jgi:hypothetical protein